jgi:hypothetical protein
VTAVGRRRGAMLYIRYGISRGRQHFDSGLMIVRGTLPRAIAFLLWPHGVVLVTQEYEQ